VETRTTTNPVTKRLIGYGAIGLVIAIALIGGLQVRPLTLLPSTGRLQISIAGDPLTSGYLSVDCHGNSSRHDQRGQVQNLTSLIVNVSSIQVHRTGALNLTGDWITLPNAPSSLDLLRFKSFTLDLTSVSEGMINLVRLSIAPTATGHSGSSSVPVTVSSDHLDAKTSAQVTSGELTSITLELIQPHVVCEGNGDLKLTPGLTETSESTD
jgi:uncharacterized protein DUF4382